MTRYDLFETGFDNFNETVNFGKRGIDIESLYEICTLAVIRSSEKDHSPGAAQEITSYYEPNGKICVAINTCLRILKNIEEPEPIIQEEFDHNIKSVTISNCGEFLLVTIENGDIFIGKIPEIDDESDFQIIFNDKINSVKKELNGMKTPSIWSFTDKNSTRAIFFIVTNKGLVKKISQVPTETNHKEFSSEVLFDFNAETHICELAYPFVCLETDSNIVILNLLNSDYEMINAIGLKRLYSIGYNFMAIDKENDLYEIDSINCLLFNATESYLKMVNTFEDLQVNGDGENIFVLGITKNSSKIQAFGSLTESNKIFDIPLDNPVQLFKINGYTEEILFVSQIFKNNVLTELRLQTVTTTDPEERVKKLIEKGQIDKAEMFAKMFNVDSQIIINAKAAILVHKNECTPEDVEELLKLLDQLTDHLLRMKYCDAVVCTTATDTRRILSYGAFMDITIRDRKENRDIEELVMKRKFNSLLRKFNTYMEIYKNYDRYSWMSFSTCDIISKIKFFLNKEQFEEATLLILSEFYKETTLSNVVIKDILSVLKRPTKTIFTFLKALIPLTLKYLPESFHIFVEWVFMKIYEMEGSHDFPECAILFLKDMTDLMSFVPAKFDKDSLEKLIALKKTLENIQLLSNNFLIQLPLCDCLKGQHAIINTLLRTRRTKEQFELLMKGFLCPYLLKCGEDPDVLLANEILDLINMCDEIYWLDTVYVLLQSITKVNTKVILILEILKITSKPWNEKVKKIAYLGLEHTSAFPLAEEIETMLKKEPVLILQEMYNIDNNLFGSWSEKEFYFRRILYLNKNDCEKALNDIRQLCDEKDSLETDYLMMREFIVQGHTETAMALMSQKEPAYLIELGKKTLEFIIFIGSQNSTDVNLRNTCCGMLNRLWHKLSAICNNNVQQEILLRDIRIAKALYVVNEMCGMEINYSSLLWCKKQDLDRLLTCMINELPENDLSDYKTLIGNCTKLASCLQQPLPFIFLKIMTLGGNLNMLLKIGENLWEISVNADLLIKGALVLLSYSRQDSINIENETFMNVIVAAQANQINSQEDMEVIKLSRKLCVKALLSHNKTNDCTLSLILEVIQWIDNLYYLSHINANVQLQIDPQRIYVGHWFSPNRSIGFIFHINNLLNSNSDFSYFKSSELINRDQLANDLENFICDTRTLLKQEQYMIAYNIVKMVQQTSLKYEETREVISKTLQTFMSETIIPEVIVSLLAEHTIDENLVFSLMLNFDADMIQNQVRMYLLKYKKQPNKLGNIAKIGRSLLANKGIDHGIQDLLNIEKKCKWWFKIKETAINYSIFFTNSPEKLLNTLIKNDLIATDNLQEYCTDFQLNLQECYLKYIKTVLLKWQPDVEYIKEINGKEDIIIKNSEADLEAVVLKVLNHIHDKNEILKLIDQIWPLINFYYYEVYLALISIRTIVSTGEDAFAKVYKPLLSFLKSYKRVSAPSHTETEQWYASQLHKTILDPLSKYRLPLSTSFLSKDIWTIIKQEVNLNTYKQWFKVSEFLKDHLDPRDICTYAINSILPNGSAATWSNDWDLTSKYDEDICKVDECAENMQDYERATVAINALMHGVPPGADKVQIAELAFKYAELYFRTFPNEEVEKIFNKVKQRYFNYTAIHILHKYELANNRCLEQVSQPILLIGELYKDPRIDSYFDDISFELPDINSAVQELCHFFELDFTHECKNILKALWTVESPLIFDCKRLSRKNLSSNLKRACYVCNSDPAFWQRFAWKHITSNNEDLSLKANAIICLYYISNENMGEFLDVNLGDFIDYMSKICLIAKLGDLGIPCMSVEELDSQNQKRLLKQLAKIPNQLAIKCIAMLCKIYGYDDIKYWEYIVNSAIEFHTVSELREYLEFLSNRCVCDYIKKGWQTVLSKAFAKFDWKTLSEAEIFLLLEASPVFELNLKPFMEICMHNNRPDIAAILKQFSKN